MSATAPQLARDVISVGIRSRVTGLTPTRPLIPHLFPTLPISSPLVHRPRPTRKPCVPFFRDPGHVIPTKRLYRQLLRATYRFPLSADVDEPSTAHAVPPIPERGLSGIRLRAIRDWHKYRGNTSPSQTASFLTSQSTLLDLLRHTIPSSPSYPSLLARNFALHLSHTRHAARLAFERSKHLAALSRPAHLTGGFLRPSILNPPLPRLRPQPVGVSMMILHRRRAHERRIEARKVWEGYHADMAAEVSFWKDVGLDRAKEDRVMPWLGSGWALGTQEMLRWLDAGWQREEKRKEMMFKPGMRRRVGRAKVRREGWYRDRAAKKRASDLGGGA